MSELILKDNIETLKSFQNDAAWYREHYDQLKKKYAGMYIAINRHKVLSDKDIDKLLKRLQISKNKNLTFVVKYISKQDVYPTT